MGGDLGDLLRTLTLYVVERVREMMKPFCCVLFGAVFLAGCAAVSPEGQKVRVVSSPSAVEKCTLLQPMEESSGWGNAMAGQGQQNIMASMRNRTAEIGGDTLLLVDKGSGFMASVIAEAYRCKAR